MDHDYVLGAAKVANAGLKAFHVVTSVGSNPKSPLLYPKTKGRTEEDLKALGLPRLSIYRPGVLMCDRGEKRVVERMSRFFLTPLAVLAPTVMTIPTTTLGKAMVLNSVFGGTEGGVETVENAAIHGVAKKGL